MYFNFSEITGCANVKLGMFDLHFKVSVCERATDVIFINIFCKVFFFWRKKAAFANRTPTLYLPI